MRDGCGRIPDSTSHTGTRYIDVFAVLKDERLMKDWLPVTRWLHRFGGAITQHMLNQDGPDHTRLRTLVHKAFTPHLIEQAPHSLRWRKSLIIRGLEELPVAV